MNNAVNIALHHLLSIPLVIVGVVVTLMIPPIEAVRELRRK